MPHERVGKLKIAATMPQGQCSAAKLVKIRQRSGGRGVVEASCPPGPRNDSCNLEPGKVAHNDALAHPSQPIASARGPRFFENGCDKHRRVDVRRHG